MKAFTTFCFILGAFMSFAQSKLNLSIGTGYPTLLHGELGYQFKTIELSARGGGFKNSAKSYFYTDLNLRYHFMKQKNMMVSHQNYWTVAVSYGEFSHRQHFYAGHNTYRFDHILALCAGHHFELSDRVNFALELGPSFNFTQYHPDSPVLDYLSLAGGLKFQYEVFQSERW